MAPVPANLDEFDPDPMTIAPLPDHMNPEALLSGSDPTLHNYWADKGCAGFSLRHRGWRRHVHSGDDPQGARAEAMAPAYVQPSRRPTDGRYGENPNGCSTIPVSGILKPNPSNLRTCISARVEAIGLDPLLHDIRFCRG